MIPTTTAYKGMGCRVVVNLKTDVFYEYYEVFWSFC